MPTPLVRQCIGALLESRRGFPNRTFELVKKQSRIAGAGDGVYITSGSVKKGELITFYPGLFYDISDFGSEGWGQGTNVPSRQWFVGNAFVLSCPYLGFYIDGKATGDSATMFRKAHSFALDRGVLCDSSWLNHAEGSSPGGNILGMGSFINHQSGPIANVRWQLVYFPRFTQPEVFNNLPNIDWNEAFGPMFYQGLVESESNSDGTRRRRRQTRLRYWYENLIQRPLRRTMAIVALRDVHPGEELYADYKIDPLQLGNQRPSTRAR